MNNLDFANRQSSVEPLIVYPEQPFPDFNDWFISVIQEIKPDFIVGIARGALRLLQLQNIQNQIKDVQIISDSALSFLSEDKLQGKKVVLFDDVVIKGSTLDTVKNYLVKREALVYCVCYVIDRQKFLGEKHPHTGISTPSKFRTIEILYKTKLWSNLVNKHHYSLVSEILKTPFDYNLDFPYIKLNIGKYDSDDIPYIVNLMKKSEFFREIVNVTTPDSIIGGIYRYTILLNHPSIQHISSEKLRLLKQSKVRLIFIPATGEIRIKPMSLLMMKEDTKFEEITYFDDNLNSYWKSLNPPFESDTFHNQALFRLATFFNSLILGKTVIDEIEVSISSEYQIESEVLGNEDATLIVGEINGNKLSEIWLNSPFFKFSDIWHFSH